MYSVIKEIVSVGELNLIYEIGLGDEEISVRVQSRGLAISGLPPCRF